MVIAATDQCDFSFHTYRLVQAVSCAYIVIFGFFLFDFFVFPTTGIGWYRQCRVLALRSRDSIDKGSELDLSERLSHTSTDGGVISILQHGSDFPPSKCIMRSRKSCVRTPLLELVHSMSVHASSRVCVPACALGGPSVQKRLPKCVPGIRVIR